MKITSVECYLGTGAIGGFVTMKINTDSGIYGWGEAGLAYGKSAEAAFGQCQDFGKLILGMDPFNTEEIWEHLHRHTFWGMGGGVVITSAMAAIDIACWDIKGKALGVPVYKLLGGKTNDKLRAYASQLQFGWRKDIEAKDGLTLLYDPKDYYRVVKEAVDEGYDAVKIDPVFAPTEPAPMGDVMATQGTQIRGCYREHDLKRSVERIAAAREAGGPDMDIIVEIHSLLDANTSAELGKALEPYRIMYYEEPTMPCNADMFKHIKEKSGLPLATGERSYTRWGFRQFFEDRTLNRRHHRDQEDLRYGAGLRHRRPDPCLRRPHRYRCCSAAGSNHSQLCHPRRAQRQSDQCLCEGRKILLRSQGRLLHRSRAARHRSGNERVLHCQRKEGRNRITFLLILTTIHYLGRSIYYENHEC